MSTTIRQSVQAPSADPWLRQFQFQFQYDTYTRDHLSTMDSIAVNRERVCE
jgi:hypothetical protein